MIRDLGPHRKGYRYVVMDAGRAVGLGMTPAEAEADAVATRQALARMAAARARQEARERPPRRPAAQEATGFLFDFPSPVS